MKKIVPLIIATLLMFSIVYTQEIKIDRVLKRDPHRDKAQVLAIMDKQMSDDEKIPLADFIITNDDTEMILPQVLKLHEEFIQQKV